MQACLLLLHLRLLLAHWLAAALVVLHSTNTYLIFNLFEREHTVDIAFCYMAHKQAGTATRRAAHYLRFQRYNDTIHRLKITQLLGKQLRPLSNSS